MNRKALLSILDVIINLSKMNVALSGNWTGESEDGNFNNFLTWKSSFNTTLFKKPGFSQSLLMKRWM